MISTQSSKKGLSDKKKNESAERATILASFSGMTATENQHFEELLKLTSK